jgi:hypothetical protein
MPAAVSLLVLAQDTAKQPILAWLSAGKRWEKRGILLELRRVRDPSRLEFAREAIAAAAADRSIDRQTRQLAKELLK